MGDYETDVPVVGYGEAGAALSRICSRSRRIC